MGSNCNLTGNYTAVCTIHYDLSEVPFKPVRGPDGREYSVVVYEVVLVFGLTEFKAYVTWKDDVSRILSRLCRHLLSLHL